MSVAPAQTQQAAFLSFWVKRDETLVFLIEPMQYNTNLVRLPVGRVEISTAAAQLHEYFSENRIHARRPERTTDMRWLRRLSEKLLVPLHSYLERWRTLVIAPHAELHLLPLHVLETGTGDPLGVTHAVTYVPNLSLYTLLLRRSARPISMPENSVACLSTAAVEDPEIVHQCFADAPSRFAALTRGMLFCSTEASIDRIRDLASTSDIIYLACHGHFDIQNPLDSYMLLSDGCELPSRINSRDAKHALSVRDTLSMRIKTRLVILQACTSGNQRFDPGDEPMGFPAALLLAGTSAVIASTWVVERNSARDFMEALIQHWSVSQCSLAEAMRYAYPVTRKYYPHPFHWGAFTLFGTHRLRFREEAW